MNFFGGIRRRLTFTSGGHRRREERNEEGGENVIANDRGAYSEDELDARGNDKEELIGDDNIFPTEIVYNNEEEATNETIRIAKENNVYLIKQTLRDSGSRVLMCERYGKPKVSNSQGDAQTTRRTTSKRCSCPLRLKIHNNGLGWVVVVVNLHHNHQLSQNPEAHIHGPRFSVDEVSRLRSLHGSRVPPRQMVSQLKTHNPQSTADKRSMHNLVGKFRRESRQGRTDIQSLISELQSNEYRYWTERDPKNISSLGYVMFAHPYSIQMFHVYSYVVIIDGTYKTNKYKIPLIKFVGVDPFGKNFNIAFAFVVREVEHAYTWVLQKLVSIMSRSPETCVTDNEKALIKALRNVMPHIYLLCRWHISRNVAAKAKTILHCGNDGAEHVTSLWQRVVYARNIEGYELSLRYLEDKFGINSAFMVYLKKTWLDQKEKFAQAWVKNVLHLGNMTGHQMVQGAFQGASAV